MAFSGHLHRSSPVAHENGHLFNEHEISELGHHVSSAHTPLGFYIAQYDTQSSAATFITCHVVYADAGFIQIDLDHKAKGQDCVDKVCRILGIYEESGYFGLQYLGSKGEYLWINTRNRIRSQMTSHPPYTFYFRVRFYAPFYMLQFEETRHQFYINVSLQLKQGTWTQNIANDTHGKLIALMTQADFGDFVLRTSPCKYACYWPDCNEEMPVEVLRTAVDYHEKLANKDRTCVEHELVTTAEKCLQFYGVFFFLVKDCFEKKFIIGIGPENVFICDTQKAVVDKYPFSRISQVVDRDKVVFITLFNDDGTTSLTGYRLRSRPGASSLFSCILLTRTFFRCDKVPPDMLNRQASRSALFFSTASEGEYAFDIVRTCREVHENAMRRIHNCGQNVTSSGYSSPRPSVDHPNSLSLTSLSLLPSTHPSELNSKSVLEIIEEVRALRNKLERFQDALLCRICMDRTANRVFFPCGHPVCCCECAERIEICPICRLPITAKNAFYAPWAMELLHPTDSHHSSQGELHPQSSGMLLHPLAHSSDLANPTAAADLEDKHKTLCGSFEFLSPMPSGPSDAQTINVDLSDNVRRNSS